MRVGIGAAVVGTMVAFGPVKVLGTVAKGTVMSVGGLALLGVGAFFLMRTRLRSRVVAHALTEHAAVLASKFLVDHEPRIRSEIGRAIAVQLREHDMPAPNTVTLKFAALPEGTGPASRDEAALAFLDFTVRFEIDPSRPTHPDDVHAPGSVEGVMLTIDDREIDLLPNHHTKFTAIDADFIDVSKQKK